MKTIIAAAIAASCVSASAAILGIAEAPDGSAVVFHDEAGPCVAGALRAEYKAKDGTTVPGCYTVRGGMFLVVFFDTDTAAVPAAAVAPPKRV